MPIALFKAAAQYGLQKIIQISAHFLSFIPENEFE